jgi:hypothetical protein
MKLKIKFQKFILNQKSNEWIIYSAAIVAIFILLLLLSVFEEAIS